MASKLHMVTSNPNDPRHSENNSITSLQPTEICRPILRIITYQKSFLGRAFQVWNTLADEPNLTMYTSVKCNFA